MDMSACNQIVDSCSGQIVVMGLGWLVYNCYTLFDTYRNIGYVEYWVCLEYWVCFVRAGIKWQQAAEYGRGRRSG